MDARHIINLLGQFLNETSYDQALEASKDVEHLGKLAFTFINNGYVWLAFHEEKPVGILIAIKEPNLWAPKNIQLRELVWYVVPSHRKTSIGGRLFAKYCETADLLLEKDLINGYFTSIMSTTDTLDLERRGFRCTERTYIKE